MISQKWTKIRYIRTEKKIFEENYDFPENSKKSDFFRNHTIDIYIRRNINLKHEIQTH